MIWPAPGTWVSWTATSSTRSRRSRSPSPSTTSTRSRAAAGAATPPPGPTGPGPGPVGYGPNLAAFAVYLMVVHFIPAHRVVALLESLTGTAPSVGFVHGMINRTAGLLAEVHQRIRTLITLAYAVCCDETPLRVGAAHPRPGKKKAERYLLVACTELYTHYLLGDRSLDHVQGLRRGRPARVGDRARPLPELRLRHEALLLLFSDGGERPSIRSSS